MEEARLEPVHVCRVFDHADARGVDTVLDRQAISGRVSDRDKVNDVVESWRFVVPSREVVADEDAWHMGKSGRGHTRLENVVSVNDIRGDSDLVNPGGNSNA